MLRGALLVTVRCSAVSSGAGCSLLAQISDLECTGITQELVKDFKVLYVVRGVAADLLKCHSLPIAAPSIVKRVKNEFT